jgi:hypothetical protein
MRNRLWSLIRLQNIIPLLIAGLVITLTSTWPSQRALADDRSNGPVRMARFSYVSGDVEWRRDPQARWSPARINLPIRQGTQVWAENGGRGEIQFDDGSRLRLGSGALVTLQTLYSDTDGEFTEITLNDGPATLRLTNNHSVYQVNTPIISVNATGPARLRIRAGNGTQLAVLQGDAEIEGRQGKAKCRTGDYLDLRNESAPYDFRPIPRPDNDNYDRWSDARDQNLDGYPKRHFYRSLPSNMALVSDDLDNYGDWRSDPQYGDVWYPRHRSHNWRPYSQGEWVWEDPYGWTWVDDEPWGWAPSHYGTWVHRPYGWGWVHGPVNQYWSPGVVAFNDYNGSEAWAPLAPSEVVYPSSLGISYHSGDWSLFFSIGQAGVYYPSRNNVYVGDPWPSSYVNQVTYVNNTTIYNDPYSYGGGIVNRNTYIANSGYVPYNARYGGATLANVSAFGGPGTFRAVPQTSVATVFSRGQRVAAPPTGQFAASGPAAIRPTALSTTPLRRFSTNVRVPQAALTQAVYRAPLRADIARVSRAPMRTLPVNSSPRTITRTTGGANPFNAAAPGTTARPIRGPGRTSGPVNAGAFTRTTAPSTAMTGNRPRAGQPNTGIAPSAAAQRAMRARQSLGLRTSATRPNVAGSRPTANNGQRVNPSQSQRIAPNQQGVTANRPQQRGNGNVAPQRQQGVTSNRPQGGNANTVPQRQQRVAPNQQRGNANTAAQRQRTAPTQTQGVAPTRTQQRVAPVRQQNVAPTRVQQQRVAPTRQQNAAPTRVQQRSAPVRQQQRVAPPRQERVIQRQAPPPRQERVIQRQAPPPRQERVIQRQAPPPRQERVIQRQAQPPQRQQAPPPQRQQAPPPKGNPEDKKHGRG